MTYIHTWVGSTNETLTAKLPVCSRAEFEPRMDNSANDPECLAGQGFRLFQVILAQSDQNFSEFFVLHTMAGCDHVSV